MTINPINLISKVISDPHFWAVVATGVIYIVGTYYPSASVYLNVLASALGIVVLKSAGTDILTTSKNG
jgi:hypothetical protein